MPIRLNQSQIDEIESSVNQYKIPLLAFVLVLVSLVFSLSMAEERVTIEQKAAGGSALTCRTWSGSYFPPGWFDGLDPRKAGSQKIHFHGSVDLGWQHYYWCDYLTHDARPGENLYCRDGDKSLFNKESIPVYTANRQYTRGLEELIDYNHYEGKCQIIQVDVTPCCEGEFPPPPESPYKKDPNCGGGVSYVVYANSECPSLTPTPSPTLTLTPTPPIIPPSCKGLQLNGVSGDISVIINTPVAVTARVSDYGLIRTAKVSSLGERVANGTEIKTVASGSGNPGGLFTPSKVGYYAVEVNAYESEDCRYLCSPASTLYKDNKMAGPAGCETGGHWEASGSCTSSGCIRWITVLPTPSLTPTLTPTIPPPTIPPVTITPTPPPMMMIQGRIYEDKDTRVGSVNRGGFESPIPPGGNWTKAESLGGYSLPLAIDLLVGKGSEEVKDWDWAYNIANHPNTIDACSDLSKQEKAYCPGSHCSRYGGFSLSIPADTPKVLLGGKQYFALQLRLDKKAYTEGWRITESYWAETATAESCVLPTPTLPCRLDSGGVRCDYATFEAQAGSDLSQVQCNKCIGNVKEVEGKKYACLANVDSQMCTIENFNREVDKAFLYVPVERIGDLGGLWVGVAKLSAPQAAPLTWWQRWLNLLGF